MQQSTSAQSSPNAIQDLRISTHHVMHVLNGASIRLYTLPMPPRTLCTPRLVGGIQRCIQVRHFSERRVIFSGIQPTGTPHLGNYVGAIQRWVQLQDEPAETSELLYSVVDLHAMTMPMPAETLRRHRREAMASLLAAGINPDRSVLFYQSAVSYERLVGPH